MIAPTPRYIDVAPSCACACYGNKHLHHPILFWVEAVWLFQLNVSHVEECQVSLGAADVVQNVLLVAIAARMYKIMYI